MVRPLTTHHLSSSSDSHTDSYSRTVFGFWLYLMTDCILFACIFACYAVLIHGTYGGIGPKQIIDLPFVLTETIVLLASSFTVAIAMLHVVSGNKKKLIGWLGVTFVLGLIFFSMQCMELSKLIREGNTPDRSAFLSAYITLLGAHGLHIVFGLLMMLFFMGQAMRRGLTLTVLTRLSCLRLFWLFLDLVWIVMFTYVYLLGV